MTPNLRRSLPTLLLALAVIAYASYFSQLTLTRYAAFEARALDMGNLDQAIWNTAHGRWFAFTNQEGTVNRLSLHVEPILLPIALLYWVRSGPPTLLVLQAVVVALGALPLFALARWKVRNAWAALVFGLAFLLNPSIQAANWLEFHPVTLAPTFLLATFYFLVTKRTGWYALFAVLAASCKEEMALLIFMIGLYALLALRRVRLGVITMVLALGWALVAVLVIQNTFADGNIHWERYAYLGESPAAMLAALVTQPGLVWAQLQQADALRYLALLLLPVAFLPLLAPEVLVLALPSLAINLLADFSPMHQVDTLIYAAPIVPFVLIAAVYGTARLVRWAQEFTAENNREEHSPQSSQRAQRTANSITAESAENAEKNVYHRDTEKGIGEAAAGQRRAGGGRWALGAACGAVLACALLASVWYGYLPWGGHYQPYTVTAHDRRAAAVLAAIPPDAKVSVQDRLDPHVSNRERLYIFPRLEDADTVLVDVTGPAWPQHPSELRASVDELLARGFGVAAADDGYLLLRQGVENRTLPESFYSAWQRPSYTATAPIADFGDALRLVDYAVTTDENGELVTKLYLQAQHPITQPLRLYVGYLDAEGDPMADTLYYPPPAVLWYPTTMWQPGATVEVQTLPWTLDADRFALAVGAYAGEKGWTEGGRLPVTRHDTALSALPVLEGGTLLRLGGYARGEDGQWTALPAMAAPPAHAMEVRFGDALLLDGVTIPDSALEAGGELPFTLYWRATQPVDKDYTAFAHLLDAAGNKVAQLDWQPHDVAGRLPTSTWVVGQPVVDDVVLALPADLPGGSYRPIVGLYHWEDGQRLPAQGADAEPGDVAGVATVEIRD
jgi:uncharacterized membrane protein